MSIAELNTEVDHISATTSLEECDTRVQAYTRIRDDEFALSLHRARNLGLWFEQRYTLWKRTHPHGSGAYRDSTQSNTGYSHTAEVAYRRFAELCRADPSLPFLRVAVHRLHRVDVTWSALVENGWFSVIAAVQNGTTLGTH